MFFSSRFWEPIWNIKGWKLEIAEHEEEIRPLKLFHHHCDYGNVFCSGLEFICRQHLLLDLGDMWKQGAALCVCPARQLVLLHQVLIGDPVPLHSGLPAVERQTKVHLSGRPVRSTRFSVCTTSSLGEWFGPLCLYIMECSRSTCSSTFSLVLNASLVSYRNLVAAVKAHTE